MSPAEVLRSGALKSAGFAHGFSTRVGGASESPYDTLNLGRSVGDEPERVAENHRRLAETVGYDVARLFDVSQVHGAAVVTLHGDVVPEQVRARQADALVTRDAGQAPPVAAR